MVHTGTSLGEACEDISKGNFTQGGVGENKQGPESATAKSTGNTKGKKEKNCLHFLASTNYKILITSEW